MEDKTNITAKTINEFIEWAAQFSDGQYLFRGVSTENYKIEASAYRRLPEIDRNDPKKLLKINKDLITKAKALGHDQKNGQQLSDLEILAELQHFGGRYLSDRFFTQCLGRSLVCLPAGFKRWSKKKSAEIPKQKLQIRSASWDKRVAYVHPTNHNTIAERPQIEFLRKGVPKSDSHHIHRHRDEPVNRCAIDK